MEHLFKPNVPSGESQLIFTSIGLFPQTVKMEHRRLRLCFSTAVYRSAPKLLELGTVFEHCSEVEDAKTRLVTLTVALLHLGLGVGAPGGHVDLDLLEVLHDWDSLEVAGSGDDQLLDEAIFENLATLEVVF